MEGAILESTARIKFGHTLRTDATEVVLIAKCYTKCYGADIR